MIIVLLGLASLLLAVTGLVLWERAPYNTESAPFDNAVWYGYNPPGIQGIMAFLTFASVSVVLLFEATDAFTHRSWSAGSTREKKQALALNGVCGVVLLGVAAAGLTAWGPPVLICGVIFCVNPAVYSNWPSIRGDSFNVCIALATGIAFTTLGALLLCRSAKWWRQLSRQESHECAHSQVRLYTFSLHGPLVKALIMLAVLAVLFFLAGYLPNDARRWTSAFMAGYASLTAAKDEPGYSNVYPELPGAWMRSRNIQMGQGWVIKIYPSNVIFYTSVSLLLVAALLVRTTSKWSHYRHLRSRRLPFFTVNDIALLCVCLVIFVLFFLYWLHDHNFKGVWSPSTTTARMSIAERWGRALGQLAVIVFSFLMIPAPRYSILYDVVGLSRESLLWLHRWLGYGMLAVTAGHIIAYLVHFGQVGTLSHNLFHVPTLIGDVRNDFTVILISWATLIMFIAMGVLALNAVRRAYYELFYYSHLVSSYLMIPALLWHAHSAWMYVLPSVTLWFVDQMIRVWQRSGHATVLRVRTVGADVVELVCCLSHNQHLTVAHPGQYVYLNVPDISVLQWHPFTLTSVASAEPHTSFALVMHIKSMGEKTWSGKLYSMVQQKRTLTVRIEGPCGVPIDFAQYDHVCLVGGGIGVVPCASIYGSLRNAHSARVNDASPVQPVRLLWATRSAELVGSMKDYLDLPASWSRLDGGGVPLRTPHDPVLAPPPSTVSSDRALHFSCAVFVTQEAAFRSFRNCESIPSERKAAMESLAQLVDTVAVHDSPTDPLQATAAADVCGDCLTFEKNVTVHGHRPNLPYEIASFFSNCQPNAPATSVPAATINKGKSLLFVCGPEALVSEVSRIGAELGIPVHQEEFLF